MFGREGGRTMEQRPTQRKLQPNKANPPEWRPDVVAQVWQALERNLEFASQDLVDISTAAGLRERAVRLNRNDLVDNLEGFEDHLSLHRERLLRSTADLATLLSVIEWADVNKEAAVVAERFVGLLMERLMPQLIWSERPLMREHPLGGWLRAPGAPPHPAFTVMADMPTSVLATMDHVADEMIVSTSLRDVVRECRNEEQALEDATLMEGLLQVVESTVVQVHEGESIEVAQGQAEHAVLLVRLIRLHTNLPEPRHMAWIRNLQQGDGHD
jgi:hypothetical protein